jgi:hypothetical protein
MVVTARVRRAPPSFQRLANQDKPGRFTPAEGRVLLPGSEHTDRRLETLAAPGDFGRREIAGPRSRAGRFVAGRSRQDGL